MLEELSDRIDFDQPPMLIGAEARNLLHHELGHKFPYTSTVDLDLSFVISDWDAYAQLTEGLSTIGDSGMAFRVAGVAVDLMPFGGVERADGELRPPWRPRDPFDVYSMSAVYDAAPTRTFDGVAGPRLRVPTIPGYAALKVKAWIDRSPRPDYRDGPDLGLVLYWYYQHREIQERLFTTDSATFERSNFDMRRGSARLLGADIRDLLSAERTDHLMTLWTGDSRNELADKLATRDMRSLLGLTDPAERRLLIEAMLEGISG